MFNPNEPLGLPKGSVRGVISLAFTSVTLYLWATTQTVPLELLALTSLIVGQYFGQRNSTPDEEPPLGAPLIPEDNG